MAASLGLIIILGLLIGALFRKMKLPGLLGLLLLGVVIGPYGMDQIHSDLLGISGALRSIALIIILLRAGLGIDKSDLIKVGKPAIKLSFIPGVCEGLAIAVVSMYLLDFSFIEGGILGFIIAAVSPAVVVPSMLGLMQRRRGTKEGIPTLILAGASVDDVVAITIFGVFLGMYGGGQVNIGMKLFGIPVSILLGIGAGLIGGILLVKLFRRFEIDTTKSVLILIGIAMVLNGIGEGLKEKIEIAMLLGIMTMGFFVAEKMKEKSLALRAGLNNIWILAEILLFVLVGAEVNVQVAIEAGSIGILIIVIGLIARSIGVYLSLIGSHLSLKEKGFCMIAYLPKATVQAAMGGVPLAAGVLSGDIILAIAVLSILLTAPAGAFAINYLGDKWLRTEKE